MSMPIPPRDQLQALVMLWRDHAQTAQQAAIEAAKSDHYREGIEVGKMLAYSEAAQTLAAKIEKMQQEGG